VPIDGGGAARPLVAMQSAERFPERPAVFAEAELSLTASYRASQRALRPQSKPTQDSRMSRLQRCLAIGTQPRLREF
jgi:hypothetical protein